MDILKFTVCGYFKGDPCYRLYISLAIIKATFVQFLSTIYNVLNIQFSFSFRSCKRFCIKFCTSQKSNQQCNTKEQVKFVTLLVLSIHRIAQLQVIYPRGAK